MKHWKKGTKILLGIVVLLLLAQLVQPAPNHGNVSGPEDITAAVSVPQPVMDILKKSCYDCHSNYTTYLWYDKISPFNYWIDHHIKEGKRELNFSTFASYTPKRKSKKLDEIAKQVEKGEMPIGSYTLMHTEAKLTDAQRKLVVDWAHAAQQQVQKP